MLTKNILTLGITGLVIISLSACTATCRPGSACDPAFASGSQNPVTVTEAVVTRVIPPAGVVQYVWEEPMVDVVDVPPGLDPDGIYYRPGHQAVVEIRQGRWSHFRDASGGGAEIERE